MHSNGDSMAHSSPDVPSLLTNSELLADSPMINTNAKQFRTEGYCLFEDVLSTEEIGSIRRELDDAISKLPAKQIVYKDGEDKEETTGGLGGVWLSGGALVAALL